MVSILYLIFHSSLLENIKVSGLELSGYSPVSKWRILAWKPPLAPGFPTPFRPSAHHHACADEVAVGACLYLLEYQKAQIPN
jgi:hypothetical protein